MKKIFLTGASSGIGLATAKALLAEGHEIWGTTRDIRRITETEQMHAVRLDLSDAASIESVFAAALAAAGGFDVVINNAGSGHFDPAEVLSNETLRYEFELLVFGQISVSRAALRAMQQQGHGLIINVSSLAARLPIPFMAAYNSGKAALAAWTMTTQMELGDSPVRLVDLQPGDICTEFNEVIRRDDTCDPRYEVRMQRAWRVANRNMKNAPKPEVVARRIARLIAQKNPPPRVTIGDTFQSVIAPMLFAALPPRIRIWGLRQYYRI